MLSCWKKMLQLRREHRDVFIHGEFVAHEMDNEETFMYSKHSGSETAIVVLNFTAETQLFKLPAEFDGQVQLLQASAGRGKGERLLPYEARIYVTANRL